MTSHYMPLSDHYKIKKLIHNDKFTQTHNKSALIIVDVQNDFLPKGSLPIDYDIHECDMMINSINELILSNIFDYYIYTQDAHPPGHLSFASSHAVKVLSVAKAITASRNFFMY